MANWFEKVASWLDGDEEREEELILPAAPVVTAAKNEEGMMKVIVGLGGNGNIISALKTELLLGEKLYRAATDRPQLQNPVIAAVDLDAGSKGTVLATHMGDAFNTFAAFDTKGSVCGPVEVINASVSQNMQDSTDEDSIDDMVKDDPEAKEQIALCMLPGETRRPRKEGGYGVVRVTNMWANSMLQTDTMDGLLSKIRQAYLDGRKVLVTVLASCVGATGAAYINLVSRKVYESCLAAESRNIDNLRIHNIILLGYAAHPASNDLNERIHLDSGEDPVRAANWWTRRQKEGIDRYVARTYFVDSKKVMACDRYSPGGEQFRHFTLGDLYALMALKESLQTPFDSSRDGIRVFLAKESGEADERVGWGTFNDTEFRDSFVSMVRLAAFTWLKLRPMIWGAGDQDLRQTPHICKLLGGNPTAAEMEKVIRPMEALISISREVLIAAKEIAATGIDYASPTAVLGNYDTVLFDPHLIDEMLSGSFSTGTAINSFALDQLTCWKLAGGSSRSAYTTNKEVGMVYEEVVDRMKRGDTAAQLVLEFYRELRV